MLSRHLLPGIEFRDQAICGWCECHRRFSSRSRGCRLLGWCWAWVSGSGELPAPPGRVPGTPRTALDDIGGRVVDEEASSRDRFPSHVAVRESLPSEEFRTSRLASRPRSPHRTRTPQGDPALGVESASCSSRLNAGAGSIVLSRSSAWTAWPDPGSSSLNVPRPRPYSSAQVSLRPDPARSPSRHPDFRR